MRSLLFMVFTIFIGQWVHAQDFDLNLEVTKNDYANSDTLQVKVYIRASSTSFDIGTSSIRVFYNDAAVNYESYEGGTSFTGVTGNGFYANTLTNNTAAARDIASINITFTEFFAGAVGVTVGTSWIEVGELTFTYADITEAKSFSFGGINSGLAGETVVLLKDNTTAASSGGELWDNITWNGSSWSGGNGTNEAPSSSDDVKSLTISSGTASIGDLVHIDSLVIANGATLDLDVSGSDQAHLFVTSDNVSVSGTFNINATSDGYAQYIGPAVSATVDQYVGSSEGWRHLGWPVDGDMSTLSGATINYGGGSSGNTYTFNTSTFAWDGVASSSVVPGSDGVSAYVGGSNFPVTGSMLTWTGTLNNGDQNNTYAYSGTVVGDANFDGWNLVANPYPSNINWETVDASQTDFSSISTWDPSTGAYKTYNNGVGDGNQYIAPGQAVWIKAATGDDGDAINITNSDRSFDGGNTFIGNFKTSSQAASVNNIALNVKGANGFEDNMFVTFRDQSITAYDAQFDAHKPWNTDPNPNMYSYATTGEKLAINSYGSFASSHIIPVGFSSSQDNMLYTISMDMAKVDITWGDVYLYDHFTGTIHNLTQNGDYTFNHSSLASENRFQIQFVASAIGLAEAQLSEMSIYSYENTVAISRPNPSGELDVVLYSITGQVVYKGTFGSEKLVEFTTDLPKAYYIVKAQDKNGDQRSQKVIIQ